MSEAIDHVQQEEHNCSSITNYTQNLQIMVDVIKNKQFFFITKKYIYIYPQETLLPSQTK